jgi:hypothetical protein
MLPGLKMLWDFVNALIEVARAAAWRLTDVVGFGVWLLISLIVVVPGWLLASFRRRVLIDRAAGTVLQVNDFLVYRWSSTRPITDFKVVRLRVPRRGSSKRAGVSHHVELVTARGSDQVIVFMDDDYDLALAVGRDVTSYTHLPLRDDVKSGVEEESGEDVS